MASETSADRSCLRWMNNPVSDEIVILVVGEPEQQKHNLAIALLKLKNSVKIRVHIAKKLPLPETGTPRPNIDLIVCMVDVTNRNSNRVFEEALRHIDFHYFTGRVVFVIMNIKLMDQHSFDISTVTELEQKYGCPVLFGNPTIQLEVLASQIVNVAKYAAGVNPFVTPGFVRLV